MKQIKVKYFNDNLTKLSKLDIGDWIDLYCANESPIELKKGDFKLIPLGVAMKLPLGYEANIVPRSSTFKNYGLIQTNSIGIVDESYCGDDDQWFLPVYATRDCVINFNDRICQFRINKKMEDITFETVKELTSENRGGFGSTGK